MACAGIVEDVEDAPLRVHEQLLQEHQPQLVEVLALVDDQRLDPATHRRQRPLERAGQTRCRTTRDPDARAAAAGCRPRWRGAGRGRGRCPRRAGRSRCAAGAPGSAGEGPREGLVEAGEDGVEPVGGQAPRLLDREQALAGARAAQDGRPRLALERAQDAELHLGGGAELALALLDVAPEQGAQDDLGLDDVAR